MTFAVTCIMHVVCDWPPWNCSNVSVLSGIPDSIYSFFSPAPPHVEKRRLIISYIALNPFQLLLTFLAVLLKSQCVGGWLHVSCNRWSSYASSSFSKHHDKRTRPAEQLQFKFWEDRIKGHQAVKRPKYFIYIYIY